MVTPRVGKPVEIQALWLNALRIASELGGKQAGEWSRRFEQGLASFRRLFWNEEAALPVRRGRRGSRAGQGRRERASEPDLRGRRATVTGLLQSETSARGGRAGGARASGHPRGCARCRRATRVIEDATGAESSIATPPITWGPPGRFCSARSWKPGSACEARAPRARAEARERFLEPWLAGLDGAGLGHLSEIADGDFPHTPRGAPFQAWSLGELLRLLPSLGVGVGFEVRKAR